MEGYTPCRLTPIKGGINLRTNTVEGIFKYYPIKGKSFTMLAQSIAKGGLVRFISTSVVQDVKQEINAFIFKTNNSTYCLEINVDINNPKEE